MLLFRSNLISSGHDFFEGVFSHDIQFLLDHILNKEKLLSIEQFNKNLLSCKLSPRDSSNKPCPFKTRKRNAKYEGSANQLRVLSRVVTVALGQALETSEVGQMIVSLQEVAEIVTSPKLTKSEILGVMSDKIREYLDLRIEAIDNLDMPNARPKHHMLRED